MPGNANANTSMNGDYLNGDEHSLDQSDLNGSDFIENGISNNTNGYHQHHASQHQVLLNGRRQTDLNHLNGNGSYQSPMSTAYLASMREPEIDRYRLKLESSQFNGSNYFKTKRQSELLGQTQDLKTNGRLSPLGSSGSNSKINRRPYP